MLRSGHVVTLSGNDFENYIIRKPMKPKKPTRRANGARRRKTRRKAIFLALTFVLGVSAISATCQLGTQCSGEAKVSLERNGPHGSFAWDR
jgi:hypothetical protein